MKIGVGLYGTNGHQVQGKLDGHAHARLVATAAFDRAQLTPSQQQDPDIRHYDTLEELLQDERVQLVSLCSPVRREQARQAIRCLEAGRHVYAEKPCAMTEADLDAILSAARRTGCRFHEMAGTAFEQPYLAMRALVQAGTVGTVIQVLAQKSYPYHDRRPQDEDVDGGLLMQVGVHALRFVEHVAGVRVATIEAMETRLGNPRPGGLRMAACMMMRLENGGLASAIANYLNPPAFGRWGNETLRIFGSRGFVEATDGGARTRLVLEREDRGALAVEEPGLDYFSLYTASLLGQGEMPLSLEDELHPTRMVIRARAHALSGRDP
ncbi:MAG: Gfo/Idh/MocA family oxidoreductase [Anaerolineae bacterium]|nr:Gfo/Idh/MocA family oxidoreductase [Anaerolineae bacterium]